MSVGPVAMSSGAKPVADIYLYEIAHVQYLCTSHWPDSAQHVAHVHAVQRWTMLMTHSIRISFTILVLGDCIPVHLPVLNLMRRVTRGRSLQASDSVALVSLQERGGVTIVSDPVL